MIALQVRSAAPSLVTYLAGDRSGLKLPSSKVMLVKVTTGDAKGGKLWGVW
jgi:hypothetical protein